MGRSTLLLRADRRHEQSAPDCQVERHEPAALAEHAVEPHWHAGELAARFGRKKERLVRLGGRDRVAGGGERRQQQIAAQSSEALTELEASGTVVRNLTVELDAAIAHAAGRAADALARLEQSRPELWFQLTVASPFFSLASQRFLRARLLEETGRLEEAAGWYRTIAQRSPYELIYDAPARERLAAMAGSAAALTR
jgi:hypothetical protein